MTKDRDGDRSETVRAFIGVPLSDNAKEATARLSQSARYSLTDLERCIKWERSENLHFTLQFLGDTSRDILGNIESSLKTVAQKHKPFDLVLGSPEWFPGRGRPRVLVISVVQGRENLISLQTEVVKGNQHLGFEPEHRAYRPHVTFGRVRRGARFNEADANRLCDKCAKISDGAAMHVSEIVLFQSRLTPQGAIYNRLVTMPLNKF